MHLIDQMLPAVDKTAVSVDEKNPSGQVLTDGSIKLVQPPETGTFDRMSRVYNCLIADDNAIERDAVAMYLSQISTLNIVAVCSNGMEAANAIAAHTVDIVFTDIDMPGLSGLELKRSLAQAQVFVFISAFAEHAAESYALDVIDFVTKPVTLGRLLRASQKAIEYIELKKSLAGTPAQAELPGEERVQDAVPLTGYFYVKDGGNFMKVETDNLLFIESMGNFSRLHTVQQKKFVTLVSLKNIELQLPASAFLRVHKQYIVNLRHIHSLSAEGELQLTNGQTIPTGALYKPVLQQFIDNRTLLR